MKTSAAGRVLIEHREGRRLSAYRDTRGILTIGVGHTGRMSAPPVTADMRITEEACDAMLARDLAPVEATITRCVDVPMTQNEFDALASLGFNIGVGGLARSSVIRKLNLGDMPGAAQAFMAWSKPAVLAGRRRDEAAQFLATDEGDATRHQIAADRAAVLSARAAVVAAQARRTRTAGAVTATAGVGVAAATVAVHHGALGPILFGFVAFGAIIDAGVAWSRHARSTALVANVQHQAPLVVSPAPASPQPKPDAPASGGLTHV